MCTIWGKAPAGDMTRSEFYDDRRELYRVEWGTSPPDIPNTRELPTAGVASPGRAPIGNVCRTVYFDTAGEVYYTEWKVCPPAPWGQAEASSEETVIDLAVPTIVAGLPVATG